MFIEPDRNNVIICSNVYFVYMYVYGKEREA
jgi:hypothetical protein